LPSDRISSYLTPLIDHPDIMEDLVGSLSGGMHVSQERQNLKSLHDYLSQTITSPQVPLSHDPYYPHPTSRSTSNTRNPSGYSLSQPMTSPISPAISPGQFHAPYPSPVSNAAFFHSAEELSAPSENHVMQRSSSSGFPDHSSLSMTSGSASWPETTASYPETDDSSGFESDAFAPLWQRQWKEEKSNPWAGFIGQSSIFGRRNTSTDSSRKKQAHEHIIMDEDMNAVEEGLDMDMEMQMDEKMEHTTSVQAIPVDREVEPKRALGFGSWDRGRRKRQQ